MIIDEKKKALEQTAGLLNVPAAWLDSLIAFESNWNPLARNKISGARGIIQFMHKTAQGLGYNNADDLILKNPTAAKQLTGPVYQYLKQYKPFPTKQSLYMAVFYPVARTWTPSTVFPDTVRNANPNITTVQDYIDFVEKKALKKKTETGATAALIMIAAAFVMYKTLTKSKGKKWTREESAT